MQLSCDPAVDASFGFEIQFDETIRAWLVRHIVRGSIAANCGMLRVGDTVASINGRPLGPYQRGRDGELARLFASLSTVCLGVLRPTTQAAAVLMTQRC